MSELRQALEDYLAIRRALGYKLRRAGLLLADFVAFQETHQTDTITIDAALAWATLPPHGSPAWWAHRLSAVRTFARHLHAIDPSHQVPPPGLLPTRNPRATPYLYSEADIAALMTTARDLRSPLRAATFETLIGLLAVSGLRIGEALRLDRDDVDLIDGVLTIRLSKFGKSREVPIHPSTVDALATYARHRDQLCQPVDQAFFVSTTGRRLRYDTAHRGWLELVRRAGLLPRSATCRPRPHALRHSFAVRTLIGWYQHDVDVQANMPTLSTYLGHVHPGSTYWYLSAAPELLHLVADRLQPLGGASA